MENIIQDRFTLTSTKFSNLHDDIAMHILERLPPAQVVQARIVCKQWNSIISSFEFSKLHHNRYSNTYFPIIMCSNKKFDLKNTRFIEQESFSRTTFVGYDHTT